MAKANKVFALAAIAFLMLAAAPVLFSDGIDGDDQIPLPSDSRLKEMSAQDAVLQEPDIMSPALIDKTGFAAGNNLFYDCIIVLVLILLVAGYLHVKAHSD